MSEVCGTCKWHKKLYGEWQCDNMDSEMRGAWTNYEDRCIDWEDKNDNGYQD